MAACQQVAGPALLCGAVCLLRHQRSAQFQYAFAVRCNEGRNSVTDRSVMLPKFRILISKPRLSIKAGVFCINPGRAELRTFGTELREHFRERLLRVHLLPVRLDHHRVREVFLGKSESASITSLGGAPAIASRMRSAILVDSWSARTKAR